MQKRNARERNREKAIYFRVAPHHYLHDERHSLSLCQQSRSLDDVPEGGRLRHCSLPSPPWLGRCPSRALSRKREQHGTKRHDDCTFLVIRVPFRYAPRCPCAKGSACPTRTNAVEEPHEEEGMRMLSCKEKSYSVNVAHGSSSPPPQTHTHRSQISQHLKPHPCHPHKGIAKSRKEAKIFSNASRTTGSSWLTSASRTSLHFIVNGSIWVTGTM